MADVSVTFGAKDVGLKATMKALSDELDSLTRKAKQSEMGFVELKTTLGRMNEIKKVQNDLRSLGDEATKTAAKTKGITGAFDGMRGVVAGLGLGAAATGARQLFAEFGRIQDLSERFNTSAESIQRLANAARLGGTDIESIATALTKAGMAATDVITGNETMAQTFERAGINARAFLDANMDQKLIMIAEAFQRANGDAVKVNSIIEILGTKGGANLIPLISKVDELRSNMQAAAVATDETVRRLAEADDTLQKLGNNLKIYTGTFISFIQQQFERVGGMLAGQGAKTIKEMEQLELEANARARLAARGIEVGDPRPSLTRLESEGLAGEQKLQEAMRARQLLEAEIAAMKAEEDAKEKKRKDEIAALQSKANQEQEQSAKRKLADEERITKENEKQVELKQQIAQQTREAESRVAAQAAEDERRSLAESLELELQIAEAKKSGNSETLKQLESEKKRVENQKKFNDLVNQFMKAGEAFGPASTKASRMIAAQDEPETPVIRGGGGGGGGFQGRMPDRTGNIGTQMREAAEQMRAQQRLLGTRGAMFEQFMGAGQFGSAAAVARGIESKAERQRLREEITGFAELLEVNLKSNISPFFGKRTAAEKGLGGLTAGAFSKLSARDQARELGIDAFGKSNEELRREIDQTIESFKGLNEGMAAPEGVAPGGGGPEGDIPTADPLSQILEQVKSIKEFIDKKLPMQALAT